MTTQRIRMTTPLVRTRADAEQLLGEIAKLTLDRNSQTIEMDHQITVVRETFEPDIAAANKSITEKTALLESWAAQNPDEFGKKKSIEMMHGSFGYRVGNPKLKTLLRKTWATVLDTIKLNGLLGYIRTKEELNKEAILSDAAQGIIAPPDLKALGIEVVQDETFFVEPNLTEISNKAAA